MKKFTKQCFSVKKMTRMVLTAVLCLSFVCFPLTAQAATFTARTTAPSTSDSKYYSSNPFYKAGYGMPNCTAYAYGRAWELLGSQPRLSTGNAVDWWSYNNNNRYYSSGQSAKLGAIAVWGGNTYGHVAVVERIEGNNVYISESVYGGSNFRNDRTVAQFSNISGYYFLGYIYIGDWSASGGGTSTNSNTTSSTGQVGTIVNVSSRYNAGSNMQMTGGSPFSIPVGGRVNILKLQVDPADGVLMYQVEYQGQIGWVSSRYLRVEGGSSSSNGTNSGNTTSGQTGTIINVSSRYNAGSNMQMTGGSPFSIPVNARVNIIKSQVDPSDGILMYQIEYQGQIGWVSSRYLKVN